MDSTLSIKFAGEVFQLPSDIITYISLYQTFEERHQSLLSLFLSKYPSIQEMPPNLESFADSQFSDFASILIKELYAQNIYSVTSDDFLVDNPGIAKFKEALKQALIEQANALLAEMRGFLDGAMQADNRANAEITGTGFGIITNSVISYAVWAVMEESALNKQRTRANAIYKSMIDEVSARGAAAKNKREIEYSINVWLPSLKQSIDLFIFSCFDKYIQILIQHGAFQADALKYNDLQRADKLLENIESAQDKHQLLRHAFMACPYALPVYLCALDNGVAAEEVAEASKRFDLSDSLLESVSQRCKELATSSVPESKLISEIRSYADAISILQSECNEDILNGYIDLRRKNTVRKIRNIVGNAGVNFGVRTILKVAVSPSTEQQLAYYEDGSLYTRFVNYIDRTILHGDTLDYYTPVKAQAADQLTQMASQYCEEIKRLKQEYEDAESRERNIVQEESKKIKQLTLELQKTSFFSFGKKKMLQAEIEASNERVRKAKADTEQKRIAYAGI